MPLGSIICGDIVIRNERNMRTILHKTNYGSDICLPSDWTGCLWLNKWWDMTNNTCTVIVGVRWLAQYKCAYYSSRHSCDRVELACASHLSLCASSSCFHSCPLLSLPPSIPLFYHHSTSLPSLLLSPSLSSLLFGKDDWVWRYDEIFPVIIMN